MAGYIVLGIEFSMTALFIASFTEQWLTSRDHIPALTGLLSTGLCLAVFGPERFLIPAMLLITLVLTLLRGRYEEKLAAQYFGRDGDLYGADPSGVLRHVPIAVYCGAWAVPTACMRL